MERGDLLARLVPLAVVLDEGLAVRRDRHRVLDARDRIADPDLDRPEARMGPDVPPDVRVVGDPAGFLELADDLGVVGVVAEARRRARPGEGGEDRCRVEARPVGSPRQNGELAESAE